jgi:hypothetical protein
MTRLQPQHKRRLEQLRVQRQPDHPKGEVAFCAVPQCKTQPVQKYPRINIQGENVLVPLCENHSDL